MGNYLAFLTYSLGVSHKISLQDVICHNIHPYTHTHTHTDRHYPVLSDDGPFPGLKENFGGHRFKDDYGVEMVVI